MTPNRHWILASARHYSKESRERVRATTISLGHIQELAFLMNYMAEEDAAIHALRLTYQGFPQGNWIRSDETIFWKLSKKPVTMFFEHEMYQLEVHTRTPYLTEEDLHVDLSD